jgi:hypothetical protein
MIFMLIVTPVFAQYDEYVINGAKLTYITLIASSDPALGYKTGTYEAVVYPEAGNSISKVVGQIYNTDGDLEDQFTTFVSGLSNKYHYEEMSIYYGTDRNTNYYAKGNYTFNVNDFGSILKINRDYENGHARSMPAIINSVNKSGNTYGSSYSANSIEEEPDFIAVVGKSGVTGFVKKGELNYEYQNTTLIPVYDFFGAAIDVFECEVRK